MKPSDLKKLLMKAIPAHLPVLIVGRPGVGKTDIVTQVAEELKMRVIMFHPVVCDPTDFKGLPAIVSGEAKFLPYNDLKELVETEEDTIAFFDDYGQAPMAVQAASMQLFLSRRVNTHKISEKVVFVAATNDRKHNAGVYNILSPVKSRFSTIIELEPSLEDWCQWASENGIPSSIINFIRFVPAHLKNTATTQEIENLPSPRTIAFAGKLVKAGIVDLESISGAVGNACAKEMLNFIRKEGKLPKFEDIMENPNKAQLPLKDPDLLYVLINMLSEAATKSNIDSITTYIKRMPPDFQKEFLNVCPDCVLNINEKQNWINELQKPIKSKAIGEE